MPNVSNTSKSTQGLTGNFFSSTWVGLGGQLTPDLMQAGTEQDWQYPGFMTYYAWYEQLPQPPNEAAVNVAPGDTVYVSVGASDAGPHLSATGPFLAYNIQNQTRGVGTGTQTYLATDAYDFTGSTAEWIVEAPPNVGPDGNIRNYSPLANYGTVSMLGWAYDTSGQTRTDSTDDSSDVDMYSTATGTLQMTAAGGFVNSGWPGAIGMESIFITAR